jgi:Na+-translocating ferredoxin:NAD+ oxidoreductase RnfD subunit
MVEINASEINVVIVYPKKEQSMHVPLSHLLTLTVPSVLFVNFTGTPFSNSTSTNTLVSGAA